MLGVVLGAGTAGFLMSAGLLSLGVGSIALRYTLAACAGYLAFLFGIKIWLTRRLGQAQRERSRGWITSILPVSPPIQLQLSRHSRSVAVASSQGVEQALVPGIPIGDLWR